MAYVAQKGATKVVDAATVNNAAYSTPGLIPLAHQGPVSIWVSCDQSFDLDVGTVAKSTTTAAELDKDYSQSSTANGAVATYATKCITFWPNNSTGFAWVSLKNVSGAAAATVSIWMKQLSEA